MSWDEPWEQVWDELRTNLSRQPRCPEHPQFPCVHTLGQGAVNDILEVSDDGIRVRSHLTSNDDPIRESSFRAWWDHLRQHKTAALDPKSANCPRTGRAVLVGAILAQCLPDRIIVEGRRIRLLDARTVHFDWQGEVREWCRRWKRGAALADEVLRFFRLAFENTECPESAWFGCHRRAASLVVGGIFLAAINQTNPDAGAWLVVGHDPPPLDHVEYKSVKSTKRDLQALTWAHASSIEVIPALVACRPLWDSFRSATARIISSSSSAGDRDAVQERHKKRRLIDFWYTGGHSLDAGEAGISGLDEVVGYCPDGVDRRPLVERQIRERRGQREFRDALRRRYGDRCCVTGCTVLAVLEAAHIKPYRGEHDNDPTNGLLLRSDIHTLFDLDLLGIGPETLRVELYPEVVGEYGRFAGTVLDISGDCHPSREALRLRYRQFRQNRDKRTELPEGRWQEV